MSELFLGIDTSNYTTSSALFDGERVLENRKMLQLVKQGEKGLRQSDADFHHVRRQRNHRRNVKLTCISSEKQSCLAGTEFPMR